MGDFADDRIERYLDWMTFGRGFIDEYRKTKWQDHTTITWTTKDGCKILVKDMEQSHRLNVLRAMKREHGVEAVKASRIGWALNYYIKKWDEEHPPLGSLEDDNG